MEFTRRGFLAAAAATGALAYPALAGESKRKKHIVTLGFDDGFKKSSIKTAAIYEKYKLSACLNIVASAHIKEFRPPDYQTLPRGDFGLWNELHARGHEIMPHGYKHANKARLPFAEAKDLILRCLDMFDKGTEGLRPQAGDLQLPLQCLHARVGRLATESGPCIQGGRRCDQSLAAHGTGKARDHSLRSWQLRGISRPADRESVGKRIGLAGLHRPRPG